MAACEKLEPDISFYNTDMKKSSNEEEQNTRFIKNDFRKKKKTRKRRAYVSLRSFDNKVLRSKAKESSTVVKMKNVKKTKLVKKKTLKTKIKSKSPPPSPPLNPTLPFVELDLDIVVDESSFTLDPSEVVTTKLSALPKRRKKLRSRGLNRPKKLLCTEFTLPIQTLPDLTQDQNVTSGCNQMHICCQKSAVLKVNMATQWEDSSLLFPAMETSPSGTDYMDTNQSQTKMNQDTFVLCDLPGEKFRGMQIFKNTSENTTCTSNTKSKPVSDFLSVGMYRNHFIQPSSLSSVLPEDSSHPTTTPVKNNTCILKSTTDHIPCPGLQNNTKPHSNAESHKINNGVNNSVEFTNTSSRFPVYSKIKSPSMSNTAPSSCEVGLSGDWGVIVIDDNPSHDPLDQDIVYID